VESLEGRGSEVCDERAAVGNVRRGKTQLVQKRVKVLSGGGSSGWGKRWVPLVREM